MSHRAVNITDDCPPDNVLIAGLYLFHCPPNNIHIAGPYRWSVYIIPSERWKQGFIILCVPARRSNQSILNEISPGSSLEGLIEAEIQILWPPDVKSWLIGKDPDAGKDWGEEEKGTTEDEMVRWHHGLSGHGFGWTLGVGDRQGGLACYGSWGHKESDMTEWLNWTELNHMRRHLINLLNEHESIFSLLFTSDFSFSLIQTYAYSVP